MDSVTLPYLTGVLQRTFLKDGKMLRHWEDAHISTPKAMSAWEIGSEGNLATGMKTIHASESINPLVDALMYRCYIDVTTL